MEPAPMPVAVAMPTGAEQVISEAETIARPTSTGTGVVATGAAPTASGTVGVLADPFLTCAECAQVLRVGKGVIYEGVNRKRLRCARLGARQNLRIRLSWLISWAEALTTPVEEIRR